MLKQALTHKVVDDERSTQRAVFATLPPRGEAVEEALGVAAPETITLGNGPTAVG